MQWYVSMLLVLNRETTFPMTSKGDNHDRIVMIWFISEVASVPGMFVVTVANPE